MVISQAGPQTREAQRDRRPGAVAAALRTVGAVGRWALRHVWFVLAVETAWVSILHGRHVAGSWHYFRQAALLLTDPHASGGGLHLYHAHPELQIGPLTAVAAWPLAAAGPRIGTALAIAVMAAAGLVVLKFVAAAFPGVTRGRLLTAGALFVPVWAELSVRAGHLDDVLALTAGAAALSVCRRRPVTTAVLVAVATGCKPWAIAFLPLVWASGQKRSAATLLTGALVAVPWLPFFMADPATLAATGFQIQNAADSALRALGVTDPGTPWWCRPAQAALGVAIGAIAVARGRPQHVLLAAIAARLLLDPQTYPYYTAGLLAATATADLAARHRFPAYSVTAIALVYLPAYLPLGAPVTGVLRAVYCAAALSVLAIGRGGRPSQWLTTSMARRNTLTDGSSDTGRRPPHSLPRPDATATPDPRHDAATRHVAGSPQAEETGR